MKRYFNTKEAAERHLEWRKNCAYARIEERGDKVLMDRSFVFKTRIWKFVEDASNPGFGYSYETDIEKWEVMMLITTQQLVDDLSKIKVIDYEEELRALIPFTEIEKNIRRQLRIQAIDNHYKTIDNDDNKINKQI